MDTAAAAFEASLKNAGYEVGTSKGTPSKVTQPHSHDFDVRALVLSGEVTLTTDDADVPRGRRLRDVGGLHAQRAVRAGRVRVTGGASAETDPRLTFRARLTSSGGAASGVGSSPDLAGPFRPGRGRDPTLGRVRSAGSRSSSSRIARTPT